MAIEFDLEGRTPIPRWQLVICCLVVFALACLVGGDMLGVIPRPAGNTSQAVNRLEQDVREIKTDQENLRLEHEKLRVEMRGEFAKIRDMLKEK